MKRPRRIEYEFESREGETYHYWEFYAKDLEQYIYYLTNNKMKKQLDKVIAEMQNEQIRIAKEKKKYKTECGQLAFLCGEQKQIDYFLNWIEQIRNQKLTG